MDTSDYLLKRQKIIDQMEVRRLDAQPISSTEKTSALISYVLKTGALTFLEPLAIAGAGRLIAGLASQLGIKRLLPQRLAERIFES